MELDKFIELILGRGLTISKEINNMRFETYRGLADLTKHINYGCKFDKYGRCRNHNTPPPKEQSMCCCGGCFRSIGYVRVFPTGTYSRNEKDRLKHLRIYAKHFSEKMASLGNQQGYWRPGKGCVLPRKYRSTTCLGYDCIKIEEDSNEWEKTLMGLIHGVKKWPVKVNKWQYLESEIVRGMISWHKQLDEKGKNHGKSN